MKEKPILFSGPMVQAIMAGRKTMTRRIVKPQPAAVFHGVPFRRVHGHGEKPEPIDCPYGQPGDRLWVRETFGCIGRSPKDGPPCKGEEASTCYKATDDVVPHIIKWRPSIHMPRWASRITLEVTEVRLERLQGITEEDCYLEGALRKPSKDSPFPHTFETVARATFMNLWESINGYGSWDENPWVWVVQFKKV